MGLISAALGAAGGVMADQWKEYFYCEALPENVLVTKGQKRVSGRSSNTKGSDNIISSGSVIAVADGQCMIIVDNGKIAELCAQPGEFIYDASTEPSIFNGKLGESILETFKNIGKRFTFGGEPPKDQRVYYFNTKEIMGNKYGTPSPVPFRVVDQNIALDMDIAIRCFGEYMSAIPFCSTPTSPAMSPTTILGTSWTASSRPSCSPPSSPPLPRSPTWASVIPLSPATPWRWPMPSTRSSPIPGGISGALRSSPSAFPL